MVSWGVMVYRRGFRLTDEKLVHLLPIRFIISYSIISGKTESGKKNLAKMSVKPGPKKKKEGTGDAVFDQEQQFILRMPPVG